MRAECPNWQLLRDSCPRGESPLQAATRADRVLSRVRSINADMLLFSMGHFIRVMASRWLGPELSANATHSMLSTASLGVFDYEHDLSRPVIRLWNDTHMWQRRS
jgi:broad specificity phosphatase PhoE